MNKTGYIDTHAHIMGEEFKDDLDQVIARMDEANIDHVMIITLSYEEAQRAMDFSERDPERYRVATGIFPEDVDKITDADWDRFVKTAQDPRIACIGEIGLDYHWVKDPSLRKMQREFFTRQIDLAKELDKPFAVHSRDAIQDTYDIMKEHHWHGLLHCFSGTKEMAREFTKLGYYIALGGALTFKKARHAVEVAEDTDPEYLLTETDCPYMAPEPVRGTRNEPANIPYILRKMAEVRNVSEEEMAAQVEANWQRFLEKK
jgi:TatD DNase family protein